MSHQLSGTEPTSQRSCFSIEALEKRVLLADVPDGFVDAQVASNLESPTAMDIAPDGRIFVAGQKGKLYVIDDGDVTTALTITNIKTDFERGLVGVTLDPNFSQNGWVYVYYTKIDSATARHNRVARYTFDGNRVVGGETGIFDLPDTRGGTFHMGGSMHFGPDGKLYVAVGDHTSPQNAPRLDVPFGKILRINPNGSIPSDNPFHDQTSGVNRSIWARGLRNPFTFNFHPTTGRMHINDVGQDAYEEINLGARGANYGWPTSEGPNNTSGFTAPMFYYARGGGRCAITGSVFYDPPAPTFPAEWRGDYFFTDHCLGDIRALDTSSNTPKTLATGLSFPVDLDVGPDGLLYYLARGTSVNGGHVGRISFGQASAPVISEHPRDARVAPGSSVTFSVSASGAGPIRYQWQHDGRDIAGANGSSFTIDRVEQGDDGDYRVLVADDHGTATSAAAQLDVTSGNAPVAIIDLPVASQTFRGGQSIRFAGRGTDAEDGTLAAAAFTWQVDYHTGDVVRPFFNATSGISSGTFTAHDRTAFTAPNVFYRVRLTVTDSEGLSTTVTRDLRPVVSHVALRSNVRGATVYLDGQTLTTPATFDAVAGIRRQLGAAATRQLGGITYVFDGWSDGGDRGHTVAVPDGEVTYVARYRRAPASVSVKGLTQTIYNNRDRTGTRVTRNVSAIDFDWGAGSPHPSIGGDTFFVRFTGKVQPQFSETYAFYTRADDGVRLFIDGELLIDRWSDSSGDELRNTIALEAGRKYDLRFEYYENAGLARAELLWGSARTPKQVVPRRSLFTTAVPQALAPTADAHVQGGDASRSNFGGHSVLYVKGGNGDDDERYRRDAYLKFDVSDLDPAQIGSAKLRVFGRLSGGDVSGLTLGLYDAPRARWGESTVTYANRPATADKVLARATISSDENQWWEFDVTAFLRAQRQAKRTVLTLALRTLDASAALAILHSRQASLNAPQLVVTV